MATKVPTKSKKVTVEKSTATKKVTEQHFVFGRENYIIMIAGLLVIILGFFLMYGKEDIFDTRKVTIAPITILIGFAIEIVAIMKRPKADNN